MLVQVSEYEFIKVMFKDKTPWAVVVVDFRNTYIEVSD